METMIYKINNKVLLYSIGNYVQYPVINHNEKEYEKSVYTYVFSFIYILYHFAIYHKLIHYKSIILQ